MLPQEIVFVSPDWFALKYADKGHQRERERERDAQRNREGFQRSSEEGIPPPLLP